VRGTERGNHGTVLPGSAEGDVVDRMVVDVPARVVLNNQGEGVVEGVDQGEDDEAFWRCRGKG